MQKLKMHRNIFWLCFIAFIGLLTMAYSVKAIYRIYQYSHLTQITETTNITWIIKKTWGDRYFLKAQYLFFVGGKSHEGETEFSDDYYMNSWAAEQQINHFKDIKWKVWYQPDNLSHSTLEKKFPAKEGYSAIILMGLWLYFIFLGFYAGSADRSGPY